MIHYKVLAAGPEPIGIDEARLHLEAPRYGDSAADDLDDAMIEAMLGAAREHAESFTGLQFRLCDCEAALDAWPGAEAGRAIELPTGPLVSVDSISVGAATSSSSDDVTLDPLRDYVVDHFSHPARIVLTGAALAGASAGINGIRIRFRAGYGAESDGAQPLPQAARAAILLLCGHLYANREAAAEKALQEIPFGVEALLRALRIRLGVS